MEANQLNARFSLKTYATELKRELKMREKVWRTLPKSNQQKFYSQEHQKSYDIMSELLGILENCNPEQFQMLAEKALSAKEMSELTQLDLF